MSTTIASLGDHNTTVTLTLINAGTRFELVSTLSYKNASIELGRETADDEGDAIEAATDLEWAAVDEMNLMGIDYTKTSGWPEALIVHFAQARNAAAA